MLKYQRYRSIVKEVAAARGAWISQKDSIRGAYNIIIKDFYWAHSHNTDMFNMIVCFTRAPLSGE